MKIENLKDLEALKEKGLSLTYPGRPKIFVGLATCGISAGAEKVFQTILEEVQKAGLDWAVDRTGCIGFCQREPLVDVILPGKPRLTYERMNPEKARRLIQSLAEDKLFEEGLLCRLDQDEFLVEKEVRNYCGKGMPVEYQNIPAYADLPFFKKQQKIALRNCGFINPEHIEEYIGRGGYKALYKALFEMTPEEVIGQVKQSGLRGRGGAGFSTGQKWAFCRQAPGDIKYVICNADEGDPGAFMDRSILEGDPHAVIEGMAIGAYAMGAKEGYLYVRAEYPLAIKHLQRAIAQAEEYGLLGRPHLRDFLWLQTQDPGRGRGLCLRGRNGPDRFHRGKGGRTPAPSALPGPARSLGLPDEYQQCQDLVPYRPHHRPGGRLVCPNGYGQGPGDHGLFLSG